MKKKLKTNKNGVWQILLDTLAEDLGNVVSNEKLIEVSGQHNYARRVRELRAEGWQIEYSQSPRGYILKSAEKLDINTDVYINLKLRQKILERDNFICQNCGARAGDDLGNNQTVKLEVDHIKPLKQGGKTVEQNLWTLCSRCNAGKKSLLDYPETIKNKILSVNLPEDIREELSRKSLKSGRTVNELVVESLRIGVKKLK